MSQFVKGRILFLGDAAHTISPIGGQGMNTGFADAELADVVLGYMLKNGYNPSVMKVYQNCRKIAAETAAKQAWLSMRVGTVKGIPFSAIRNIFLKLGLKAGMGEWFSRLYAMLTIPFRNKEEVYKVFNLSFSPK